MADEPFRRLVEWFVAEAEGAKMHGHESFRLELDEGIDGLLRVHVDIAFRGGVVGSYWQKGDFHRQALADLAEAIEVGAVATMKNRASCILDMESTKPTVRVVQNAGAPMAGRCECDFESAEFEGLPVLQFLHMVEAEAVNKATDIFRHKNGLVTRHGAQRLAVQMVKMGMRDQHKIDGRQVVDFHAGLLDAFDDFQPLCPVGINEHAMLGCLDEEGGVADPSDADLAMLEFGKDGLHALALAFREKRRNDHFREEIPLVPSAAEFHVHMVLGFASCGDFSLDELRNHAYYHSP